MTLSIDITAQSCHSDDEDDDESGISIC